MRTSPQETIIGNAATVIPITDDREFFGMREEWNALLQESQTNSIFLTFEWLEPWWRAYGSDKELYILRVMQDGRLIGIAPFYRETISRFGLLSLRTLNILGNGSGDSDYLDWISERGHEETVTHALIDHMTLTFQDWDLMLLNEVPETSPHLPTLRKFAYQKGWYWEERDVPCTYTDLPSNWDNYLHSLKPRMRTKIRSLTRRLEQSFQIRFDLCQNHDDLSPRLESLFEIHNLRWQQNGEEGVFVGRPRRQFYREMSSHFLTRGWLRLYSLAVNDRYVAHQFCFEYRNCIFLLQEAYSPQWAEYGIGNVLRAYVIRDCIERKVECYDFLGGITPHKLSWGASVKKSLRVSVGPQRLRVRLNFTLSNGTRLGKKWLKPLLPQVVLAWARALKRIARS